MGGNLAKFDSSVHVVIIGLDTAGKSTVLYRLKFDQYVNTVPTVGFNHEKVKGTSGKAKGVNFMIWDVGGQDKVRPLWKSYTRSTDGIIFVVDSSNSDRIDEARVELFRIAKSPDMSSVPILVLANKQDLPEAKDTSELEQALSMAELGANQLWTIQPCCAITGEGLDVALEQLYELILKRRKLPKVKRKFNK